jgi:ferric-dicitrate binding protein FerR (iron transport regulator)
VDEIMAWKNGMFIFNNENITSIMKKVSRWYNVDVAFKGDMDNINFTGNYSRSKSLPNLLKNIELIEKVHFVIEGRRVTIIAK